MERWQWHITDVIHQKDDDVILTYGMILLNLLP